MKKIFKTSIMVGLVSLMVGCTSIEVDRTSDRQLLLDVEPELLVMVGDLEPLDKAYTEWQPSFLSVNPKVWKTLWWTLKV